MRNYADEDNLHARIYAMRGRLLSLRDYASMVREQQTSALQPFGIRDLVEAKENLFREQIAPVIAIAEAYDKYEQIFLAYLRQFETRNAKMLLAKAYGKKSLEQWYDIGPFATLDKELLKKNLSPDEIKSLIADTCLADDLKDFRGYLRMEINLDISQARNLYNSSKLLSFDSKKEFQEMALRRIAVLTSSGHTGLRHIITGAMSRFILIWKNSITCSTVTRGPGSELWRRNSTLIWNKYAKGAGRNHLSLISKANLSRVIMPGYPPCFTGISIPFTVSLPICGCSFIRSKTCFA